MNDVLKDRLAEAVGAVPAPSQNLPHIQRVGRLRRWSRFAVAPAVLVIVGAGVAAFGPQVDRLPEGNLVAAATFAGTPFEGPADVPSERVASFAVRAMASANLLDPLGDFNDYRRVQRTGDSWLVTFEYLTCARRGAIETCTVVGQGRSEVGVELVEGEFRVNHVGGPFDQAKRDELFAYRESANAESIHYEFPSVYIGKGADEGITIRASNLWTGPIAPDVSPPDQSCELRIYDSSDSVTYAHEVSFNLPAEESMRAGSILMFGAPEGLEARRAEVVCD